MTDKELAVDQSATLDANDDDLSTEDKFRNKLKEAMSVEREDIGSLRVKLTVSIPRDTLDDRFADEFAELKREASVPGFRPGHAPMRLVEKRFGNDVGEQIKSQFFTVGYLAATEKEELEPLGDPMFWVKMNNDRSHSEEAGSEKLLGVTEALDHLKLPKEGPLVFQCELELKPEFELPELKGIPLSKEDHTVTDEDVDAELKRARMMRGTFAPIEKGKVERDDMIFADLKMSVDGKLVFEAENEDLAARDIRLKGVPLTDFGDAVVGKKVGETFEFEATVPDDHDDIDQRGKTASFEFKLNEIKRLSVPPIDKEFLTSVGFETEKELRDTMRSALESRVDEMQNKSMHDQLGTYLVDNTPLEIPEGLSQRQTDRSLMRRKIELLRSGMPESEVEKQIDELRSSATDEVTFDLKLFFILEKIGEDRDVVVPEEELNNAIAQIAQRSNKRFDRVRDELSKGDGLASLYMQLRDSKVLDELLSEAIVSEAKSPKTPADKKTAEKTPKKTEKKVEKKAAKKTVKKTAAKKKTAKKKTS